MRAVSAGGQSGEFFLYSGQTDSSCLRQDWECPESHPHLAKWSETDYYWCYVSRDGGASCNMASSGAPPPPDGMWGLNQDPCELKMVWSSSQEEGVRSSLPVARRTQRRRRRTRRPRRSRRRSRRRRRPLLPPCRSCFATVRWCYEALSMKGPSGAWGQLWGSLCLFIRAS